MGAVNLDRLLGDAELGGDFLVEQAADDERADLTLASGEAQHAVEKRLTLLREQARRPLSASARPTVSMSGPSSTGFDRKSNAPAFIARTDMAMSP